MDRHNHAKNPFDDLTHQISQIMDEMKNRPFFQFVVGQTWQPPINLYETDSYYIVCVAISGMNRPEIDVQTQGRILTITGERVHPIFPEKIAKQYGPSPDSCLTLNGCSVHLMEIQTGKFKCEVEIPGDTVVSQVTAHYEQGYLWVLMPKQSS